MMQRSSGLADKEHTVQKTKTIAIRRALPTEATILTEIAFAAKRHWGYPEAWIAQWRSALTITPKQIAAHPTYVAITVEPVAVAMLSRNGRAFELEHFWVRPDRIGRGVGRQLFAHMWQEILAMNGSSLRIESDPHAVGFYQRMGAQRIGEIETSPGRFLPVLQLDGTG